MCVLFFGGGCGLLVFHSYSTPDAQWFNGTWRLPELPFFIVGVLLLLLAIAFAITVALWCADE